jgi:hypothetical protein
MTDLAKYQKEALDIVRPTCSHPIRFDDLDQIIQTNPHMPEKYRDTPVAYLAEDGPFRVLLVEMRGDRDEVIKTWRV